MRKVFLGLAGVLIAWFMTPRVVDAQCWACALTGLGNAMQDIGAAGMRQEIERQREERELQLQHEQEMQRLQNQYDLERQRLQAAQRQLEQQRHAVQQQQRRPNTERAVGIEGYPAYLERLNIYNRCVSQPHLEQCGPPPALLNSSPGTRLDVVRAAAPTPGLPPPSGLSAPMPAPAPFVSPSLPGQSSQLHLGNQTYTQTPAGSGPTYQTQGTQTLGSDGSVYNRSGNLTFGSDGTTGITSGMNTFVSGPNGQSRTCQTIGVQTFCN